VANPEGAKQNRRYRKPGTAAEVDLFSTTGGNEAEPESQDIE
jgi:hypothetical protein